MYQKLIFSIYQFGVIPYNVYIRTKKAEFLLSLQEEVGISNCGSFLFKIRDSKAEL